MMWIVLTCLAAVILTVILLLTLPVRIAVDVAGGMGSGFNGDVRVMALGGLAGLGVVAAPGMKRGCLYLGRWCLVSFDLGGAIERFYERKVLRKPEKKKKEKKKTGTSRLGKLKSGLGSMKRNRGELLKVARDIRHAFSCDYFRVRLKVGLRYPHLTGYAVGFLNVLNGLLPPKYTITPEWSFSRAAFEGEVDMRVTIALHKLWAVAFGLARRHGFARAGRYITGLRRQGPAHACQEG